MILYVLFFFVTLNAAANFMQYSFIISDFRLFARVGVDFANTRAQQNQGRANVIFIQPQAQRIFSSYPLFNGTFSLTYPIAPNVKCVFEQSRASLATLFDFTDKGWLSLANRVSFANGDVLYSLYFNDTPLAIPSTTQSLALFSQVSLSAFVPNGQSYPSAMNVSVGPGLNPTPYAIWTIGSFTTDLQTFADTDFAPPPNDCLTSRFRCSNSTTAASAVAMDLYRVHQNDSFMYDLENANVATLNGACYFACSANQLTLGKYISQYSLKLSNNWNAYARCNLAACSFKFANANPVTYGMLLGVGREESNGNGHDDSYGQCDAPTVDPKVGYWYYLAKLGRCPRGKVVGFNNCTWDFDYKVVKTITMQCANITNNCINPPTSSWLPAGQLLSSAFKNCPAIKL